MEAIRTRTTAPVHSGRFALARVVALAGKAVAALIVVGIVLVVFEADPRNEIVEWLVDAAHWLVGPFRGLFDLDSHKWQVGVNWGLAAVAYLAASRVIVRLLTAR